MKNVNMIFSTLTKRVPKKINKKISLFFQLISSIFYIIANCYYIPMTMTSIYRPTSKKPLKEDEMFYNPTISRTYASQYNSIYYQRTRTLKSRVMKQVTKKWSDVKVNNMKPKFIPKILDIPSFKPIFMIGTVFAEMKYKPDVLKEVEENVQGHSESSDKLKDSTLNKIDQLRHTSYSDPETDRIWLEDDSGRVVLTGELLDKIILVTGLIVGVLGMEIESGIFHVVDIVYPEACEQKQVDLELNDGKILLCSGLNINETTEKGKLEILKNWIMGEFEDDRAENISEMLILGNSVKLILNKHKIVTEMQKYNEESGSKYDSESIKILDNWLKELLYSIPISILPGETDITEIGLPKQPMHRSLFHNSSRRGNFKRLTNPTWYDINNLRILVTSGENINDILKYVIPNSKINTDDKIDNSIYWESRLKLIEDTLLWQVIAPTAPDTLCCYPFDDKDPFTLVETPHVYIIGNQPKFETSLVELKRKNGDILTVRIIAVPVFDETNQCVLLDTKTLECELVELST